MSTHLLLTFDFPPMRGGIARMMGELARSYPPGTRVVSTGRYGEGPRGRRPVEANYNWDRVTADLAGIGHEIGTRLRMEVAHQ